MNNDAELAPGALASAGAALSAHPEAGSLAMSLRFLDRPGVLSSTGLAVFGDGSARDRDLGRPVDEGPRAVSPVAGACGGAAVWRREVLDRVGALGEEFFLYSEGVDIDLRAQRAGYACLYVPDAVVLHRFGASVARVPAAWRIELAHRNSARVLVRNFGTLALARGVITFALRGQRREIRRLGPDHRVDRWVERAGQP